MPSPITNLYNLHCLRHNFQMYRITRESEPNDLLSGIVTEMRTFCEGCLILSEERFEDYVNWFKKNTDPAVIHLLKDAMAEAISEMGQETTEP